jgi:hypothetical protein
MIKMAKIKRKELLHYIRTGASATPNYEVLGADLESLEVSMNMNVESSVNILGESSINISNGTKTASIEPYFANSGTGLYTKLQGFIDNQSELDDLITDVVEVKKYETEGTAGYPAFKREVKLEVVSYGGSAVGYQIPFNVHFTGVQVAGEYDIDTDVFTPDA